MPQRCRRHQLCSNDDASTTLREQFRCVVGENRRKDAAGLTQRIAQRLRPQKMIAWGSGRGKQSWRAARPQSAEVNQPIPQRPISNSSVDNLQRSARPSGNRDTLKVFLNEAAQGTRRAIREYDFETSALPLRRRHRRVAASTALSRR